VLKATIAGLLAHKLRLALTAFSIVLGIAFVGATLTLSNGFQSTFDAIFQNASTPVSVVVQGHVEKGSSACSFTDAHRPIPESVLPVVASVSGVQAAAGVVCQPGASALNSQGKPYYPNGGPPQFGQSWVSNPNATAFRISSGSPPTSANEVVIDNLTASKDNIKVGQTVNYVFNDGSKQPFVVSGIASYSGSLAGATFSFFQLNVVQQEFNLEGKFSRVDASAQSGVSQTDLRNSIASHLPSYAEATTESSFVGQQVQSIDSVVTVVRTVLLVFALIALFVGSYIIINTFSILVAQRTRELALLRALGASRGQIFRMVLLESLVTGLFGSAIGCLLSLPLARGLYSAVSSIGSGLPKANLGLQTSTVLIGMGLGTAITVVASILPARKASRVSPVEAIRDAADAAHPLGKRRIAAGILVTLLGGALIGFGLFSGASNALLLLGAGAFVLYIGVSSLAPLTVVPVAGFLGIPIAKLRGTPGKLARTNSIRAPRRAAATAAALMIGVSLVVGIAVLTASFKASTTVAFQDALVADYLVFGAGGQGSISPTTTQTLAQDPSFSTVGDIKSGTILVNGSSTSVFAMDPSNYQKLFRLDVASGDPTSLSQPNTIFVDQQDATGNNWKVGDVIQVNFPQKGNTISERIGCIFNANAITTGYMISTQEYAAEFPQQKSFIVLLKAAPGVSHSAGMTSLNTDLQKFPTLKGFDAASFLALQSKQLDTFTLLIDVFLIMAIIIASLGIVNTLALSIIERTHELGLLRAIGLTRSQTRTMVRWESVLIAFLGLVLGAVLGIALGAAVVRALASSGIGHIAIPWGNLIVYAIGALIIGLLAAILPARRAARINILEAITTE
jgi:putative ABC transport system permease protein